MEGEETKQENADSIVNNSENSIEESKETKTEENKQENNEKTNTIENKETKTEENNQPAAPEKNQELSTSQKTEENKSIEQKRNNLNNDMSTNSYKRNIAYKFRIGQIQKGKQNYEAERLKNVEINGKNAFRVNLIANIVDKFMQEGEKQYGSITLDDATGQIRVKAFGEDIEKFKDLNQGDTIMVIGLLRAWNNELYLTPEIIKKKDPSFLLIRKLEVEASTPEAPSREELTELKDKIISLVKEAEDDGGIDIEKLILDLKESPEVINNEVKKLLEEGIAYEPRPGKLRWLG